MLTEQDNYDWFSMKQIRKIDDAEPTTEVGLELESTPGGHSQTAAEEEAEQVKLHKASKVAKAMTAILAISFLVLWPMPLYGTGYIFSPKFFTGWVVVGILWLFCSSFCVGVYPLWEGRHSLTNTFCSMWLDVTGRKHPVHMHREAEIVEAIDSGSGTQSPSGKSLADDKVEAHSDKSA
jgi:hypothetical protein